MFNEGFVADFGESSSFEISSYYRNTSKIAARRHALVSPKLPNFPLDFVKFAGAYVHFNIDWTADMKYNISNAKFDALKPALEAFVHFTYAESEGAFIFADIQGRLPSCFARRSAHRSFRGLVRRPKAVHPRRPADAYVSRFVVHAR